MSKIHIAPNGRDTLCGAEKIWRNRKDGGSTDISSVRCLETKQVTCLWCECLRDVELVVGGTELQDLSR